METIKASELIFDSSLYPRGDVDSQHISYMVRSLEAGLKLPPIIIERKSKKIVDGVHRWNAHRRFSGDDAVIECIMRTYKDDGEMYLDAARFNAIHGASLTTFDRVRCCLRGKELGLSHEKMAEALCMTTERLEALVQSRVGKLRTAVVDAPMDTFGKGNSVALKRTIRHKAGATLTIEQAEVNEKLGGMEPLFYVHQLQLLIQADLLDQQDEKLMQALKALAKMILAM